MAQKRLDIELPAETRDALTIEAKAQRKTVTALATQFLQRCLSEEQGNRLELQSFPLIREVIQLEMRQVRVHIRQEVQAELEHWSEKTMKELSRLLAQSGSRQAALTVKALREDETARRFLILLAERLLSATQAQELYELATSATSKHLALVLQQPED